MPPLAFTLFALTFAAALHAEFVHVEQAVTGLDCISCAQSVDKSLKKIKGVETAVFRLEDGVAVLQLKPANIVKLDDIRDALKRIGYTPAAAQVTVRGSIRKDGEKWLFRVVGCDAEYSLDVSTGRDIAAGPALIEGSIAADRGAPLKVSAVRPGE